MVECHRFVELLESFLPSVAAAGDVGRLVDC